jgi:hypothetical protein
MGVSAPSSEAALASFLAKYAPEIEVRAKTILVRMRELLPSSIELIYDNYNALVIGFGPTERASEAIFSIAVYPKWVSLFFLQARGLKDPDGLLQGSGSVARHIVLPDAAALDDPKIRRLMEEAKGIAAVPLQTGMAHQIVVKSVSAKQRPRRPIGKRV